MFSLRHLSLLALLSSCSVYNDSLLDTAHPADQGRVLSNAGSGSTDATLEGGLTSGGTKDADMEQTGNAGTGKATGGSGPSVATGGTGNDVGGSTATAGSAALAGGNSVAGSGNEAGSGGTPSTPSNLDLIDDMEDGNRYLVSKPPRYGFWYAVGDQTPGSTVTKVEDLIATLSPARGSSTRAVHFTASGNTKWGATIGLSFTDMAQTRVAYDTGNALGISFWVRGSVTDNTALRVLFPIPGSDSTGTMCGGKGQGLCLDHFATDVSVTSEWQQVTIAFSSLHQAGWGQPLPAFDPAHLLGIEWTSTVNLEVWIDDLALMRPE